MTDTDTSRTFQMRVRQSFTDRIDDWRRGQKDLPSQAEAIRRLVEIGLTARPSSQGDAPAKRRSKAR
jgi:hypothetical protein